MFKYIRDLINATLEEPTKVYTAWIPVLAMFSAIIWIFIAYALMMLFENLVLKANLSLPYQFLFVIVVTAIGWCRVYFRALNKLVKAETYQNINNLVHAIHIETTSVVPLNEEETEELIKSFSKEQSGDKQ